MNAATLPNVTAIGNASADRLSRALLERRSERRQQDQGEDHGDVFDDQPAHRDATALGLEQAPLLHRAQEHDRARHRQGEAEYKARAHGPAEPPRQSHAEQCGACDLRDGSGDRDASHRQQVGEREMEADAEHQENHADLGQLVGQSLIGDVSGRERADQDAGNEVADERRKPQPLRQHAECECEHEGNHDGRNQRRVVRHREVPELVRVRPSHSGGAALCPFIRLRRNTSLHKTPWRRRAITMVPFAAAAGAAATNSRAGTS